VISHLSPGLLIGMAGLSFSDRLISLWSSGLLAFGTVLEIRTFGVTCDRQPEEVLSLLSDREERLFPTRHLEVRILRPQPGILGLESLGFRFACLRPFMSRIDRRARAIYSYGLRQDGLILRSQIHPCYGAGREALEFPIPSNRPTVGLS
jgi:hypothetical protein